VLKCRCCYREVARWELYFLAVSVVVALVVVVETKSQHMMASVVEVDSPMTAMVEGRDGNCGRSGGRSCSGRRDVPILSVSWCLSLSLSAVLSCYSSCSCLGCAREKCPEEECRECPERGVRECPEERVGGGHGRGHGRGHGGHQETTGGLLVPAVHLKERVLDGTDTVEGVL
jgi:hypothetical protein